MIYDLIIIGSGFGGAVTAARLGKHVQQDLGGSALLLEKGNDHSARFDPESAGPPVGPLGHRYRNSLSPEYLTSLTELYTDPSSATPTLNVLTGKGFGGGSNVYCGVSLRAPGSVFERQHDSRGRYWPSRWNRSALEPYYRRVEDMLKVHRLAWTSEEAPHWQLACKRDFVFAEGCRRIGAEAAPLPVAVDQDAGDGWWTSGQVHPGRQNLTLNYLAQAKEAGVEMRSGFDVTRIAPGGAGYIVYGTDRRGERPTAVEIECRTLVLAAGSIGSTGLLLKSRDGFGGARRPRSAEEGGRLGAGLSSNGDYGVMGRVGDDFELPVEGFKGKPMCSFSPTYWRSHGILLIPFYAEPLYPALGRISSLLPAEDPRAVGRYSTRPDPTLNDWGKGYKSRLQSFGDRMLTMGCLALDEGEGEISVASPDAPIEVRWPVTHTRTEERWSFAFERMRDIYDSLGGEIFADGYRTEGTVHTSHPLGGCAIGSDDESVCDALGEVRNNPGLFVIDGASIPAGLGVNPSLTIAAMAERMCEDLIQGRESTSMRNRLS